ncbi:MAG: flavin reductase family protein [Desulfuromonadaceae bacterium]|nr:flavin reductase family protein [Desulfuromonadaceae bacterium]MDD4131814.1 flavin reductase family protein [Desulfuromonadaceae bacterium]
MKKSLGAKPLALPSPVWVIGSYNSAQRPNIMVISWGGICCTTPPCVAISIQKTRSTYANIIEHNAFTINIPSRRHLAETDYAGIVSGINTDKFSVTGLTAVKSEMVNAPYVKEFPLIMECELLHTIDIGSHTQFIAQICDVKADEAVLGKNGMPTADKVNPIISSASERAYYALGDYLERAYSPGMVLLGNPTDKKTLDAITPDETSHK